VSEQCEQFRIDHGSRHSPRRPWRIHTIDRLRAAISAPAQDLAVRRTASLAQREFFYGW